MTRRLPLFACLALLAASTAGAGSWLQDEPAATDAPSASDRLGMRPGSHEVQLYGGFSNGGMAYSNDMQAPPLTAEPVRMRIELDSGSSFGIAYNYQVHENWLVGGSLSFASSEFNHQDEFDFATEAEFLASAQVLHPAQGPELTLEQKEDLLARIEANSQPRDVDLTMLDVSAIYLLNPEGPWVGEFGAGIGYASASADEDPMVWEMLFRNECDPTDPNCAITVANELTNPDPSNCPSGNDPCVTLTTTSNLSWHAMAGLRYSFTDAVQFRAGVKVRLLEAVTDPGDSMVVSEATAGVVFRFGGD
jgi:opacity protein-like surface antigen